MKLRILLPLVLLSVCASAQANLYNYSFTGLNTIITDNDANGYQNSQTVSGTVNNITDINVTLNISGGYNGDLYGYLVGPNGGFAVLLNRVGKTATDDFGYSDTGFNVTLNDQGGSDIHLYSPNNTASALTGTWAVDGREIDPNDVVDTDSRTALLSSFNSVGANGNWTLFLADVSAGGESTIVSWGLQISTVPEPISMALVIFAALAIAIKLTLRQMRKSKPALLPVDLKTNHFAKRS